MINKHFNLPENSNKTNLKGIKNNLKPKKIHLVVFGYVSISTVYVTFKLIYSLFNIIFQWT